MTVNVTEVDTILAAAIEITSPEERAEYVRRVCGENPELRRRIDELLAAHFQAGDFLERPPATVLYRDGENIQAGPGTVIGPYKLLQQIGEGGMGVVFMAKQRHPMKRTVALKIIKPGMDSRQVINRFEAERQALALMDHPNIAKVLDAGTTESGRPYFVMELVKGVPITKYCDEKQLSLRERLELFKPVCEAVQHAHQKGIIHRDIKPTNVLVAEYDGKPVPKIIDFGVAKATAQELTEKTMFTEYGQLIGTFEYMSPEQASFNQLDVDTRSDVYSLGVLLYELLTGSTPFERERLREAAFDEVLRIIRDEEPPKPSTRLSSLSLGETAGVRVPSSLASIAANRHTEPARLSKEVSGELDWIVMRSLEKDCQRRYQTASAFADDLHRYLTDQPVEACPPSAAYRFRKFARRNKAALFSSSLVMLALLAGAIVSTWQAIRATRASQEAETSRANEAVLRHQAEANEAKAKAEALKSKQVADFLKEIFNGPLPWRARGRDTAMLRQLMDNAATRIGDTLADQPEVEAELREVLGFTYWSIDEKQKSEQMLRRALELRRKTVGDDDILVARSLCFLAKTLRDFGKLGESESLLREALAIQRKSLGNDHEDVAFTLRDLGVVLTNKKSAEAEGVLRESLAIRRKLFRGDHWLVADSLMRLGGALDSERAAESEALLRESVAMARRLSPNSPDNRLGASLYYLAVNLQHQSKLPEAEAAARESLSVLSQSLGNGSASTVSAFFRLNVILSKQGKTEELERIFNQYSIPTKGRPSYRADLHYSRGDLFRDKGNYAEAASSFREALAIQRQLLGDANPRTIALRNALIDALEKAGEHAEAELLRSELPGPDDSTSPPPSTAPQDREP